MVRIYDVQSAVITILKSDPPQIVISACGKASSTGWTNPTLGAWYYIDAPKDGVQDFDFTATEPTGISLPVLTPITASSLISRDPSNYWGKGKPLVGVRIHARDNTIEEKFDANSKVFRNMDEGWPLPWPFPTGGWEKLSGPSTGGGGITAATGLFPPVGCTLRVYNSGDPLTKDYRPDRYNVELSPSIQRIVNVWYG
ncbi:MAG: hypothetical protein U1E61_05570 [Bradyrhizobium sp.]